METAMTPCVEQRIHVGPVTIYLQCNLLSCMFGFALFTNSVQIAIGPLCAMIGRRDDIRNEGEKHGM